MVLALLPLAGALAGCATGHGRLPPPTLSETEFLCSVLSRHVDALGTSQGEDGPEFQRIAARQPEIAWSRSRLPDCPKGTILWGFHYVDGFGLSADGSLGIVSGGWQGAPLADGSGYCYFERRPDGWALAGCAQTGVS